MYHEPNRFRRQSPKLEIHHPTFEDARRMYSHCERTALRAYTKSEASRIANALIRPVQPRGADGAVSELVAMFFNPSLLSITALYHRRLDFVIMLVRSGRFEKRIARRLVREGKLSAEVLA